MHRLPTNAPLDIDPAHGVRRGCRRFRSFRLVAELDTVIDFPDLSILQEGSVSELPRAKGTKYQHNLKH